VNISNDFFQLAWDGEPVCMLMYETEDMALERLCVQNKEIFCDFSAIALSFSSLTTDRFLQLEQAQGAIKFLGEFPDDKVCSFSEIYMVQCRLLGYLIERGDLLLNKMIGQRIDRLRKGGILGYDTARKLISILTMIEERKEEMVLSMPEADTGISYYQGEKKRIEMLLAVLKEVLEDQALKRRAEDIPQKLQSQKFSIGVTGVMNAGKSTMLNALLGKEILGTAVVPETANLTVIKYAKAPRAVVHFWKEREWEAISKSAETLDSMAHFVAETEAHFERMLGTYVTKEGKDEEIALNALPQYTSAEHSDKKCNLVKSVTLYTDLEFVREGVEIVDTPGLDDPVVQREEITNTYLSECDLLCHLMNVNQSATQKDLDFIIESLTYRNVAQLLVVITRIDTVTESELEEVIAYTQSSIRSRLELLGKGAAFEALISRIVFLPIAGKIALMHRTGRAEEAGYTLEKSGILRLESYLREVLFGEEALKVRLVIDASKKEILSIVRAQDTQLEKEKELLGKSAEEIEQLYLHYQKEQLARTERTETLLLEIQQSKKGLESYLDVLGHMVSNRLNDLRAVIKRRIMDDVSYTLRKEKRKPAAERIEVMLQTGLQDGFIDLLREYRYQFQKRLQEELDHIGRDFALFASSEKADYGSAGEFFGQHFDTLLLTGSYTVLATQINTMITKASKKDLAPLGQEIEAVLAENMRKLEQIFSARSAEINQALIMDFEQRCQEPINRMTEASEAEEKILQKAIEQAKSGAYDAQTRLDELTDKHHRLQQVSEVLRGEGYE